MSYSEYREAVRRLLQERWPEVSDDEIEGFLEEEAEEIRRRYLEAEASGMTPKEIRSAVVPSVTVYLELVF